jgi:hypothetical protein
LEKTAASSTARDLDGVDGNAGDDGVAPLMRDANLAGRE